MCHLQWVEICLVDPFDAGSGALTGWYGRAGKPEWMIVDDGYVYGVCASGLICLDLGNYTSVNVSGIFNVVM